MRTPPATASLHPYGVVILQDPSATIVTVAHVPVSLPSPCVFDEDDSLDAVCVGKCRDRDGDWYDCAETAEWMGILEKGREPKPFCGTCIDDVETRLYPSKNGNVSTPGEAFPTSLLAGSILLVSYPRLHKS